MPKGQRNPDAPPKSQIQLEMGLLKSAVNMIERAKDAGLEEDAIVNVISYLNQRYLPAAEE
jgi:hypothetical protein